METAKKTRYLAQWLQAFKPGLKRVHCKAHTGHPGNEMVDSISRSTAANKWKPECRQSDKAADLVHHPMFQFLWWDKSEQQIPPPWHKEILHQEETARTEIRDTQSPRSNDARTTMTALKMTCATMNVFAGLDQSTTEFYNKRQAFSQQIFEQGWMFIGMQETRATKNMTKSDPYFHMLVAEGKRGQYGTELWISKTIPCGSRTLQRQDLHVLLATPTSLLVAIKTEEVRFDVMVLHAPQRTDESKEHWWTTVTEAINKRILKGIPIVLLGDFNARLGSVSAPGVGQVASEEECPNGAFLRKCITVSDLTAVNTTPKHQGEASTYANTRIDYIITSTAWMPAVVKSWKDTTIDLMHLKDDHRPVVCQIEMAIEAKKNQQAFDFDRKEAFKKENEHIIQGIFEAFEEPKWEDTLDNHVLKFENHVREGLKKAFPKQQKRVPKHPYIGEKLWQQIENRKAFQKEMMMLKQQERKELLQKAFGTWCKRKANCSSVLRHQYQAIIEQAIERAGKEIKAAIKKDRDQHIEDTITRLREASNRNDTKMFFKNLRMFRPKDPRKRIKMATPPPHLEDETGPVDSKEQWDLGWHRFWAKLECAEVKEWSKHEKDLEAISAKNPQRTFDEEACQIAPTLEDVTRTIRTLKKGKAPGPDNIPAEAYMHGGQAASKAIHTIAMKQLFRQKTPKSHRGGWAFPISSKERSAKDHHTEP